MAANTGYRDKDDKYPFQFGAGKAKLIIEHYEEIKKFWAENALKGPTKKDEIQEES